MITYEDNKGVISTYAHECKKPSINLSLRNIVKINKFDEVGSMVNLTITELMLYSNEITEIKGLNSFTNLTNLDLNCNDITEIKGLDGLIRLKELNLSCNQITEIKGLDNLTRLTKLDLHCNQIKELKGLDSLIKLTNLDLGSNQITEIKGLDSLIKLTDLDLGDNQITEIKGVANLVNLTNLGLYCNPITKIKGLDDLVNLTELSLYSNLITEIKELDSLIRLTNLDLSHNQITKIKGLDNLIRLTDLDLGDNQITEIRGLDSLIRLSSLRMYSTRITEIPLSIMNLRKLHTLIVDFDINPIIERFLNRNAVKEGKAIYDDSQNVHDSHIVKSIQTSIYKLMSETAYKSKKLHVDNVLKEIVDDDILDDLTKSQLIEHCQDKTVHSILNLTFDEVLWCVWDIIISHKESDEIKKILNAEMKDSMCKCFTGRLSRLVNCLNGFDERVSIVISDKQEILNVIIKIRNTYEDVEKQKEVVMKELLERGYDKELINEYLIYLE